MKRFYYAYKNEIYLLIMTPAIPAVKRWKRGIQGMCLTPGTVSPAGGMALRHSHGVKNINLPSK
jgi:hypothetical protein